MKVPWVSRLRLELAEERIAERDQTIAELKAANALLQEALDLQKAATHSIEKERDQLSQRPFRLLGSDVRRMATQAATERARDEGKTH